MRRLIAFACEGSTLVGTLDEAPGRTGLLIVSGGNEVRAGAHRGQALLAERVAAAGCPVFRFDRRGVGDSEGDNRGWASSALDIAAALDAFRREQPQLARVVAVGNCDAATALACFGHALGIDALVLTNPWTGGDEDALPPAAAIRHRYRERLASPAAWRRALTGQVDIRKLFSGLHKIARSGSQDLADRIAAGLVAFAGPVTIVVASGDGTAQGFRAAWGRPGFADLRRRIELRELPTSSHSFQHEADKAAMESIILSTLTSPRG